MKLTLHQTKYNMWYRNFTLSIMKLFQHHNYKLTVTLAIKPKNTL